MRTLVSLFLLIGAFQAQAEQTKEDRLSDFFASLSASTQFEDSTAYESHFTEDAVMFLPNRKPLRGRSEIGRWFIDFRTHFLMVLDDYRQEQVDVLGDVALVRSSSVGHYSVTETGQDVPFVHKFLDVLKYEGGRWLMTYHVASSATFEPGIYNEDWEGN